MNAFFRPLQHSYFPEKCSKFLRISIFKHVCERLFEDTHRRTKFNTPSGPILESKGMRAMFQKKSKKVAKII